jgi:hypothetical protein
VSLQVRLADLVTAIGADIKKLVAQPVTGVKIMEQFVYTDPAIARPAVPSYVSLNWVGPSGSGGAAPTNLAIGDTWDMVV